jgi:hypothetical protein
MPLKPTVMMQQPTSSTMMMTDHRRDHDLSDRCRDRHVANQPVNVVTRARGRWCSTARGCQSHHGDDGRVMPSVTLTWTATLTLTCVPRRCLMQAVAMLCVRTVKAAEMSDLSE